MNSSPRTRTLVALVAVATLTTGCGGGPGKVNAARYAAAAHAQAAAASAKAAIEAMASKLEALTTTSPPPAAAAATATATTTITTAPAPPTPSSGGLLNVPSAAAAFSSLRAAASSSAAAPPSANLSGAFASANAALGGALSQLDVSKQCATIPTAAVQALVKDPIGSPRNAPEECGWTGTDLHITLDLHDPDSRSYKDLTGTGDHPIAGLGDVAEWSEPVPGATLPNVNAHKGSVTCRVEATDVPHSTIRYTGSDPFFKITDADSLAYANQEAALCARLFTVSG